MSGADSSFDDDGDNRQSNPRAPRQSVFLNATVERFGGSAPTRHRIRDLSTGGVRIDQAGALQVGSTVLVTVGALEAVGATVIWSKDGLAGLRFAQPINPDDARAKAAISARSATPRTPPEGPSVPTAGWVPNLSDPYGKRR